MYLLFQLKSHAYMYESTPQHIIDEESAPGPVAQWMESSDDDDSSSSSSDSDGSSGSNTTAKRIRRVMRGGRRRRKSSFGSKDTAEATIPTRTPSIGTNSVSYTDAHGEDSQGLGFGHRFGAIDPAEDGDDEEKEKGRSRKNSIIGGFSKKERKKERKRREKRERKQARRNGDDTINEGIASTSTEKKPEDDPDAPRRVDFAAVAVEDVGATTDSSQKRPFTLRGIRPQISKTISQNVFMQPSPDGPMPTPKAGPIPRVKYGIRRTNSLPDRLNQSFTGTPARTPSTGLQPIGIRSAAVAENKAPESNEDENISRTTAVMLLLISTGLVAVCAEFMVDAINGVVSGNSGLSEAFIGLIILPIVGNAAEHVTAVTVASKNKMDLAIGVAVGSSIQIALFVTPFIVLLGWCMSKDMSLYFTLFETVSLFVSAFIVNFLVLDGRSNYLEGALLCAAYVIIAVAAFFYPQVEDQSVLGGNPDASGKMIRSLVGSVMGV
jgi:Ca2+:H+ antiporter